MCFRVIFESRIEENTSVLKEHLDLQGLLRVMGEMMKSYLSSKGLVGNVNSMTFINFLEIDDYKSPLGSAVEIYIIFRYIWENSEEFDENMNRMITNFNYLTEDEEQDDF